MVMIEQLYKYTIDYLSNDLQIYLTPIFLLSWYYLLKLKSF